MAVVDHVGFTRFATVPAPVTAVERVVSTWFATEPKQLVAQMTNALGRIGRTIDRS